MKLVAVVAASLAGFSGFAAAQSGLAECAQKCVNQYTTSTTIAGCKQLDAKCICENSNFLDGIACCLADGCTKAEQEAAVKYAKDICTGAGVSVPDQVTCKSATPSGGAQPSGANQTSSAGQTGSASQTAAPAATNTPNAGSTMGSAGLLGGLVAVLAAL
ncbi:CFEM domain-containing protein [Colletotrichum truncatum]|uniref:CFEM domain-containing protein n=1 Tax=Colletotrichum truncatum TaxID=5467 RepID=A0ACC3YX68_COLTU|nr:CFEM domain-containing protein [Colletotrichum truncatum]KAF6792506.1 CFEM domain-containing protein [Colletotrichum truncatum]